MLEIGGGTGIQALALSELGLDVTSVEVSASNYSAERVFPIVEYDGKHLPFEDNEFDIVFSSNVLEHIPDLDDFHREMNRVLKGDGYMVHAMPSGSWRTWSNISHYWALVEKIMTRRSSSRKDEWFGLPSKSPADIRKEPRFHSKVVKVLKVLCTTALPARHGEVGNCVSEIYSFSRFAWREHFKQNGYLEISAHPMGLFYTGNMVFHERLSLPARMKLAKIFGSSCVLYVLRPGGK